MWALPPVNAFGRLSAKKFQRKHAGVKEVKTKLNTTCKKDTCAPMSGATGKGCVGFQHCAPIGIKQTHCVNQPASIDVGKSTSSGVSLSSGLSTVWVDGIT
jgi:hypothetical protein